MTNGGFWSDPGDDITIHPCPYCMDGTLCELHQAKHLKRRLSMLEEVLAENKVLKERIYNLERELELRSNVHDFKL